MGHPACKKILDDIETPIRRLAFPGETDSRELLFWRRGFFACRWCGGAFIALSAGGT
jgi:hypothetical protein